MDGAVPVASRFIDMLVVNHSITNDENRGYPFETEIRPQWH